MQFNPELAQAIIEGRKTQTRRPVKPGDTLIYNDDEKDNEFIKRNGRIKWAVGKTYAVQPRQGKPSVARIKLLRLRREDAWVLDFVLVEGADILNDDL